MKVVFTGSRHVDDIKVVRDSLRLAWEMMGPITELHEGGARGADTYARTIMEDAGIKVHTWLADWEKHGKGAGLIRNTEMVRLAHPDYGVAVWVDGSTGTKHCINQMQIAKIPRVVFYYTKTGKRFERVGITKVGPDGVEVKS